MENNKKQFLVVSSCTTRGNSGGLTGQLVKHLNTVKYDLFEISLFDIGFFNYNRYIDAYDVKNYYELPKHRFEKVIRKIPEIRVKYAELLVLNTFDSLLSNKHFDLIIVFEIPAFADRLVTISHKHGAKVIFYPWGSDILRCSNHIKKRLQKAFNDVDFVTGSPNSNCIISVLNDYGVPKDKLRLKKLRLNGTREIDEVVGKYSKKEMLEKIGIPYADYLIVGGYNGSQVQRHKLIIESIAENLTVLPSNYLLIFPITYGCNETYYLELKELCEKFGVKAYFIRDYLTNNQIALLHLATDLFIEIQPTDSGNAFLIEALYAKNQIITGKWLKYEQFEQFGIPYHLINDPEELSLMINRILTGKEQPVVVPESLRKIYYYPIDSEVDTIWHSLSNDL